MSRKPSLSGDHLNLDQVDSHYTEVKAALEDYFSPQSPTFYERFLGYTPKEVRRTLSERLLEHDQLCSLMVLSSLEAFFRVDYTYRIQRREKDALSREFREMHKKRDARVSLEEDILAAWLEHSNALSVRPRLVSDLKTAFKYRHWLAHGRYWTPKLGRKHSYDSLFILARDILDTFPLVLD